MPIEGKFYEAEELVLILRITKQAVAKRFGGFRAGLYPAELVEPALADKGIKTEDIPVRTYDYPEGATWAEREKEFNEALAEMEKEEDENEHLVGV